MDLACGNLTDDPGLTNPSASVFLDIWTGSPILNVLFLLQPLTSIQDVAHEEGPRNVPISRLMD
jgi:hypothetical protein